MTFSDQPLVTAAYTIQPEFKERIERMAEDEDPGGKPNASKVMRRILREYFASLDSTKTSKPAPAPTGKAAKVVTPA